MDAVTFLNVYLPALIEALQSKDVWRGPEYFIAPDKLEEIEAFTNSNVDLKAWLDFVDAYFDAKAHNFKDAIDGIDMTKAQSLILKSIKMIESSQDVNGMLLQFKTELRQNTSR